ncbi:WLM domain-containing protein [Mycena alexandri]|uniref:WLM domain-containing protein n=1 Tax=Mycena alexandri TaxID=1745969 RepID=A0AAD6TH27_9AGAR|nr:WLM domain-containing protein [Mycena alexandri]
MSSASTDSFVQAFTHLKGRPKEERALPMLQRIASLVKPIMRKHGWNLPLLAEFFPANDNLIGLNVNGGQKILLRLRPAWAPDTFYEEEEVVQTMLHELTHNVHGPHDEKFYKFLSGLQDEYDALQRSGYSGEGFFSRGNRVGIGASHDLPPHLAKAKALEAAEKRRKAQLAIGNGGGRLGGRTDTANLTPRELAARAADRRARDEKACGSGQLAQQEADKAAKESIEHKAIDLTLDSDSDDSDVIVVDARSTVAGPSKVAIPQSKKVAVSTAARPTSKLPPRTAAKSLVSATTKSLTASSLKSQPFRERPAPTPPPAKKSRNDWTCRTCTLINPAMALQCDACLTQRPPDDSIGWACLTCGETGMPPDFWTCRTCGTVKLTS